GVTKPNDAASLSGGLSATGNITFNLYDPDQSSCSGTPRYTQTASISGDGTYTTSNTTFTVDKVGTWRWRASYSGDTNNNAVSTGCNDEQITVGKSTPTIVTDIHDVAHNVVTSVPAGTTVH